MVRWSCGDMSIRQDSLTPSGDTSVSPGNTNLVFVLFNWQSEGYSPRLRAVVGCLKQIQEPLGFGLIFRNLDTDRETVGLGNAVSIAATLVESPIAMILTDRISRLVINIVHL